MIGAAGDLLERGVVFGYDLLLAALLVFMMSFLVVFRLASDAKMLSEGVKDFSAERTALAVADSILKNRNEKMPEAGSAARNAEMLRIESGVLDYGLLKSTAAGFSEKNSVQQGLFVREVSLEHAGSIGEKIFSSENMQSAGCATAERFGLLRKEGFGDEKVLLRVVVCSA